MANRITSAKELLLELKQRYLSGDHLSPSEIDLTQRVDAVVEWLQPEWNKVPVNGLGDLTYIEVGPEVVPKAAIRARLTGYCAIDMPDSFRASAEADTDEAAAKIVLGKLKEHYGREFRLTWSERGVVISTVDT